MWVSGLLIFQKFLFAPVIENLVVVGKWQLGESIDRKESSVLGLISSPQYSTGHTSGVCDQRNRTSIAGIHSEESGCLNIEVRFLSHLSHGRMLHRLSTIYVAGRKTPTPKHRFYGAADEQQIVAVRDEHDSRKLRVKVDHHSTSRTGRPAGAINLLQLERLAASMAIFMI